MTQNVCLKWTGLEIWSRIFQSRLFHPCDLVPRFTVLTFPVPRFQSPRQNNQHAGPRLWNSLPVQLRNPDVTCGLFRRQLKGHLVREAWTRRSVTSDTSATDKKRLLTYTLHCMCHNHTRETRVDGPWTLVVWTSRMNTTRPISTALFTCAHPEHITSVYLIFIYLPKCKCVHIHHCLMIN